MLLHSWAAACAFRPFEGHLHLVVSIRGLSARDRKTVRENERTGYDEFGFKKFCKRRVLGGYSVGILFKRNWISQ